MPTFSERSAAKLATAHPDLQRLFNAVIAKMDCSILCGHRDQAAQDEAYETGKSKLQWPNSKHNAVPSLAVDAAPYPLDWSNLAAFSALAVVVKSTAAELGIVIEWGGDWKMRDCDHFQLTNPVGPLPASAVPF